MARNLLNTINIDVPADAAEETIAFWPAAPGADVIPTRMDEYTILDRTTEPTGVVVQTVGAASAVDDFERRSKSVG